MRGAGVTEGRWRMQLQLRWCRCDCQSSSRMLRQGMFFNTDTQTDTHMGVWTCPHWMGHFRFLQQPALVEDVPAMAGEERDEL